jgi:hypothetical protein
MRRWLVLLSALMAHPFAEATERAPPSVLRLALTVGANEGVGSDLPLRFAETDAARFAAVLREIGGHERRHVWPLFAPSPEELLRVLRRVGREVAKIRRAGQKVVFTFYYSGHANPSELRLTRGVLPYAELRRELARIAADVRLVILDACHSGAFQKLARKGGKPSRGFRIRLVDELSARGEVVIASSAPNEEAQESATLQGSFFTTHLITGLRGAADRDGDARVTLGEAYQYAYAQTLRSTALSPAGLQHPRFQYEVTGRQDLVLSWPGGAASTLLLRATSAGQFLVFSARGHTLYAEVPAEPGDAPRIALPEGVYLVHKRTARGLLRATLRLARGQVGELDESSMAVSAYETVALRGKGDAPLLCGGTRCFAGYGIDLRFAPVVAPNFGGAYADTARAFNFPLGSGAGVDLSAGFDGSRWWSLYAGASYVSTSAKRRLDTLTISSLRILLEGRLNLVATSWFRLAVGAGPGLYRSSSELGDVHRVGWIGGAHAGISATFYLWSGFGLGFGYSYDFVHALEHDALDRPLDLGGHRVTVTFSFRL